MNPILIFIRGCVISAIVLVGSGCVSPAQRITEIQPSALQPDTKVGVIWISPCSENAGCKNSGDASTLGQFVPDGAAGLLTYTAAMSAHTDVIDALDQVSADATVEEKYLIPIAAALEARGVVPIVDKSYRYQGDLSTTGRHDLMRLQKTLYELHPDSSSLYFAFGFDYKYDFSAIAEELDVSTLVVLHLQSFGIRRSFGPLAVPLGRPHGMSLARVYIWDEQTQSVLYNDYGIAQANIGPNWREPGDWTQVFSAANSALELTLERAVSPLITALK